MPPASELVSSLLEADMQARQQLLREAAPTDLEAAIAELGHRRDPRAAEVLALIDQSVDNAALRALRKAARRELHRLRSAGIEPPSRAPSPPAEAPGGAAPPRPAGRVPVSRAFATDIDSNGTRALWLLADRPLGGAWVAAMLIHDLNGIDELSLADSTRKRFERELQEQRSVGTWVSLPGDYAHHLVREAADLNRERHHPLPTRYVALREVFGEAPGPPERALVYETISPVEANFHPEWLADGPSLFREPEVRSWYVPVPARFRARALEVAQAATMSLLVPGNTPEQRALNLLAEAAHETLTPEVRRAFRRRLEETAYILLETERLGMARVAVAAARALEDPHLAIERHPLMQMLLSAGLARLLGSELVGSRRATEVFLEVIERLLQREQQGGPPVVESRPSGLILPR